MSRRTSPLDERELGDVLLLHANALSAGEDNTEELLSGHPETHEWLEGLLRLARRIQDALKPVEPSERFVADLRAKLAEMQQTREQTAVTWRQRRERAVQVANVLGTVVSILAVLALTTRLIGALVLVIAFLIGRRRRIVSAA